MTTSKQDTRDTSRLVRYIVELKYMNVVIPVYISKDISFSTIYKDRAMLFDSENRAVTALSKFRKHRAVLILDAQILEYIAPDVDGREI